MAILVFRPIFQETFLAAEDMTTKQFYFVELNADGTVKPYTTSSKKPLGVLQNKPRAGEAANVLMLGVTQVVASAAIAKDAAVSAGTDGKAITATTGAVVGRCREVEGLTIGMYINTMVI